MKRRTRKKRLARWERSKRSKRWKDVHNRHEIDLRHLARLQALYLGQRDVLPLPFWSTVRIVRTNEAGSTADVTVSTGADAVRT